MNRKTYFLWLAIFSAFFSVSRGWAVDEITVDHPQIRPTSDGDSSEKNKVSPPGGIPRKNNPARSDWRASDGMPTPVRPTVKSTARGSADRTVDLSTMDSPTPTPARGRAYNSNVSTNSVGAGAAVGGSSLQAVHSGVGSMVQPGFKVFFDFLFHSRAGYTQPTFDNYHSLVLMEIVPTPDIQFSFELASAPRYYELDYKLSEKVEVRLGKIWIPFDDMAPHNIYGGKVNTSKLAPGAAFLPDLWTDLGVGLRFHLVDTAALATQLDLYVVNGFHGGGTDPKNPGAGASNDYPDFSQLATQPDNNADKAIGGRLHFLLGRTFGVGASVYTARWSNQLAASKRVNMLGLDSSLRIYKTEIRAGLVTMFVQIPNDKFLRAGAYVELGQKLDRKDVWKVLLRAGILQMDDRVVDVNDQKIVSGALVYHPNLLEFQLRHNQDLYRVAGKPGYAYTDFRVVMAF